MINPQRVPIETRPDAFWGRHVKGWGLVSGEANNGNERLIRN